MGRNIELDVLTAKGETIRLHVGQQRTVAEVAEALRETVGGWGEARLEFYFGNSKLKPDYTLEFFVQAYGAKRDLPVALRLESFAAENGGPSGGAAADEIVLLEESVGERPLPPPAGRPGVEPAPAAAARPGTRRFREGERSYRVRIERPAVLALGANHRLRVQVRALSASPSERTIEIEPRFPGCLVVPERAVQPASGERAHEFQVTPMAAGRLAAAAIRFGAPSGRSVEVPLPAVVRSPAAGRWLAALGVLAAALERFEPPALYLGGLAAAIGIVLVVWSRPRRSPPREETVVL